MDTNFSDPVNYSNDFKVLKVMRKAMVAGCLTFLGISILLTEVLKKNTVVSKDLDNIFLIVCASLAVVLFFVRQTLFQKRMEAISREPDLKIKLDQYRAAVILSFALIEGPALLSIICYFLTANQ